MTAPTLDSRAYTHRAGLLVPTSIIGGEGPTDVSDRVAGSMVNPEPVQPSSPAPASTGKDAVARVAPPLVTVGRAERRRRQRVEGERAARHARLAGDTARVQRWQARAAEARQLRRLLTDPDVRAVRLMRQRARWTAMAWMALLFSMGFTMVNVQRFAAIGSEQWSPMWVVAWLVDPAFSVLLVGVLIARGSLAAVGHQMHDTALVRIERVLLAAIAGMNIMPTISHRYDSLTEHLFQVALHMAIPALAFGAAVALPLIQAHFARAIEALSDARPDAINLPKLAADPTAAVELSANDRTLLTDVRNAITTGVLEPDPTGHAIHRRVMSGRGDKARAYRVAGFVNGWRPGLATA
ncbi:hypothetical protein [Salinispora tropica]|uniref:hypothetical protein n=1 Tax=Salinispora tropica TaxID=168695 RepID=UPI000683D842|nr:hypothetical protein [Salinispora tropica]